MTQAQHAVDTAKIRPGDRIMVAGWPPHAFEVADTSDRALLTVKGPTGREFRVGRRTVSVILTAETNQPQEVTP